MVNVAKRVLVFDSGVGGLSVLDAIAASDALLHLDYLADNSWLPYGLKSDAQLRERVPALLSRVSEDWAPDLIVVACNTASTTALEAVRAALAIPIVGVVPPIKPAAALTRTGVIGLLATPATVQRPYTNELIAQFAAGKRVIRLGSAELVQAAERKLAGAPESEITHAAAQTCAQLFGAPGGAEIDVVALACTHFPLLAHELAAAAPRPCVWLDSGEAIARRVRQLLNAPSGEPRLGQAGFTDADAMRPAFPAFQARGIADFMSVGPAPYFSTAPADF